MGLRQDPIAIRGREGGRGGESVFAAILVQDITVEG